MGSVDLEASQEFMQLCDEGIRNLTINDVESWEWDTRMKRLPSGIRQTMADKIRRTTRCTEHALSAEGPADVGSSSSGTTRSTELCDSDEVKREMCTKANRVSEYIELFQSRGLWEVADMTDKVTMEGLSCAIHAMIDEELAHKCMGRAKCPLMLQLEELREEIDDMLENIPKLKLEYFAP